MGFPRLASSTIQKPVDLIRLTGFFSCLIEHHNPNILGMQSARGTHSLVPVVLCHGTLFMALTLTLLARIAGDNFSQSPDFFLCLGAKEKSL